MISKREKMIYFPYTICLHDGIIYDRDSLEQLMIYDTDFYLLTNKQLASRIISAGAYLESDVAREFCAWRSKDLLIDKCLLVTYNLKILLIFMFVSAVNKMYIF